MHRIMANQNKRIEELNTILHELIDLLKYPVQRPRYRFSTCGRCCEILSINSSEKNTIIHIMYYAQPEFINGGWVRIQPETFIRKSDTDEILPMREALYIPISPNKHEFQHYKENLSFQLVFPPIPKSWKKIDLIEKEPGDSSYFNFYEIELTPFRD
ncbi:MAG: hypothetical protein N2167_00510 [Flavobacteriales bacterium]|nr:hypothetical protein [Flavobacteriales bacterium]